MARRDPLLDAAPVRRRRGRGAWITVAVVGLVAGAGVLAVPAIADDSAAPADADRVIVCESGVLRSGDILTSSAVAVRVRSDSSVPVPEGCREG